MSEPSLPSSLQIAIDHEFKNTDIRIILSGSNEGFIESEVLGRKTLCTDDAVHMIPATPDEERIRYYTAFGSTSYYLAQIDPNASFKENIEFLFFNKAGLLYEEPTIFLRQELREPVNYNSILSAVANGATFPKEIAEKAGVEHRSIGKHLKTLEGLDLIERTIPFGDNPEKSRKGPYSVRDSFFAYWYRFVSRGVGAIESEAGNAAARGGRLSARRSRRTLANTFATVHFASMPLAAVPGAAFGVWHNISGAAYANILARSAGKDAVEVDEVEQAAA